MSALHDAELALAAAQAALAAAEAEVTPAPKMGIAAIVMGPDTMVPRAAPAVAPASAEIQLGATVVGP